MGRLRKMLIAGCRTLGTSAKTPKSDSLPGRWPLWMTGLCMVLAGCTVGPDFKQPEVDVPGTFRGDDHPVPTARSVADLDWREFFPNAELQGLIEQALQNNRDLQQVLSRVEQSRALLRQAQSGFYPSVGYQGTIGRGRNAALGQPSFSGGSTQTTVLAGVDAAWEIDLWGRVRRLDEAAQAQLLASESAARAVAILLVTEVANSWYLLRSLDARKAIAEDAVESYTESYNLFEFRYQGGVASLLEVYSAEGALENARALLAEIRQQTGLAENALSVLLGVMPRSIERGDPLRELTASSLPVDVPAGLPSELLQRRFDVQQAEQVLHAATAQVGVAEAAFFPQLSLTGLLGRISSDLSGFTAGSANAWSAAAALAGPIFTGGQLSAQYDQAVAIMQEAAANYDQVVLTAFQEVSDQLISRQQLVEVREARARAATAYARAVEISFQRYRNGLADYLDVLQSQQGLFPAEDALAQTVYAEWVAAIQLYRVLGGGWKDPEILDIVDRPTADQ